jgi:hypothetical protein
MHNIPAYRRRAGTFSKNRKRESPLFSFASIDYLFSDVSIRRLDSSADVGFNRLRSYNRALKRLRDVTRLGYVI